MCGCGLFLGLSSGPQAKEGDAMSYPFPSVRISTNYAARPKSCATPLGRATPMLWSASPAIAHPPASHPPVKAK